ncbi:uncharacterized protein K460DRAFT_404054 [Cucurbitaria berberidis CBS 394.84]|uniref:Uncharacterized protein n=1 Tax=Cucurbitaria berberidis CBS 394.84 TaxID=1168544 RepID=A0A9P4GPG6_9PLEO|nr:uncharacterized protein K460DRAFT_404054 [Cucurbitaria berberidis CBS 394.84]KAF1848785.1 hypothetical protein K460DRAFT_404054 [Cucurbitaria berberidis CBS 394.84]
MCTAPTSYGSNGSANKNNRTFETESSRNNDSVLLSGKNAKGKRRQKHVVGRKRFSVGKDRKKQPNVRPLKRPKEEGEKD